MSKIKSFKIDTTTMPSVATTRSFTITGEVGAKFMIIALQDGTLKYYDFIRGSFENGHTFNSNLVVVLSNKNYHNTIMFPSGGGDYVIKLIPFEGSEVKNRKVFSTNISKLASTATITFSGGTTNTANYGTFPTTTSTGDVTDTSSVDFNWDVLNASTDAGGFGLRLTGDYTQISGKYWYFTTTEAVADNPAGDGEDSATVMVADITDLGVGTELYYHKGTTVPTNKAGSAVGTTTITAISSEADSSGNYTITFSQAVAFEDTETMTFRAYGSANISAAIDMTLGFTLFPTVTPTSLTQTVRADSDGDFTPSTTVTLKSTHGVSGGNLIGYTGFGVDNSSGNLITSVTPDCPDLTDSSSLDNDGLMVVQLAQTLKAGTVLTFKEIFKTINFAGNITITKYPTGNRTIYLDLDKLITVGTAS